MSENDRTSEAVYRALRSLGWIVPQSESGVAENEKLRIAGEPSPQPSPGELRSAVPGEGEERDLRSVVAGEGEARATLARAAREAGRLSPEVEEAMRRDRRAAEEQLDKAQHGEDHG